ncbi:MFS transporter [Deinococcus aerophilus]|uniref:Transporter, MFS family protein n=1 Tax=Deinococcus aerophilus TaxID=522488 RepID=A0ABQ2GZA4_9DEIO|nr:MFS transporter [Deinococcus aerophilus]GGM19347.1 putative transporter, MFS family protein [Deinococcus aerophilus]
MNPPSPVGPHRVVWSLAMLATVGYGALYYAQPLLAVAFEEAHGWTRTQTGLAFTLALLLTAGLAPWVGRVLDTGRGARWLSLGALLGSLAFLLLALTSHYLLFVFAWLLAGVSMGLTFYEAVFTVLRQQVAAAARRPATLTVTLVAGLASTVFVPLTTALLGGGGLTAALLGLSAVLLFTGLLIWWAVPDRAPPAAQGAAAPFTPDPLFGRLTLAFTLARVVTVGVGVQLAPLLLTAGHPPAVAAGLTGLLGLAALPGRILFVPLLERLGLWPLTLGLVGLMGVGTAVLHFPATTALSAAGIVAFGLASGALTLARTELLAHHYPPELFGTANGRLARPVNLAQAVTPLGVGLLYTLTGAYTWSLHLLVGLALGAVWSLSGGPLLRKEAHPDAPAP